MTSVRDTPANTAVAYSTFNSLRLGRTSQAIVGRLIRFWDSKNVNKNGEFMGITILLLDEMDLVINAFVPANRASKFRPFLKGGSIVRLDRFEVVRCPHMYKITEHEYVIRFTPSTRIFEVQADPPTVKYDKFMVRRYDHLQVLANTNLELPDVVGEIRSVQGSDLNNDTATSRVVVRLLIEPDVTVYLSLWDEAASTFRGLLKTGNKTQSVMLVTTVNPKLFGGNLYLNSTQGSRFFFDTNIPEIAKFIGSIGGTTSEVFACVDTLQGLQKKELVSIGDLNTFISNSNEQTQEADFLCKATIVGVIQENGWSFLSCTNCHKKLEKHGSTLNCTRCVTSDVTGVVRFRVELAVDDGKDSATFVVFDREMTRLIKEEAAVLALEEVSNGGDENLPRCLEELTGKEFMFQIRVTPFNFTPNHRTFTVSTITEDSSIGNNVKGQGEHIPSDSGAHRALKPSSSRKSVLEDKIGEEGGAAAAHEAAHEAGNAQKKRKRVSG